MAASLGVARGLNRAGGSYLFLFICASVLARIAPLLGKGREDPCAPRTPAYARALFHFRNTLLYCRRAESSKPAVDSDLRRGCVIWWALRAGMDGKPALWSANPKHSIADAGNRTLLGMGDRCGGSGDPVYRGIRARGEISFGLGELKIIHGK